MDATAQPRPFAIGGHVSFWSGCYVAGCTALAGILLGGDDLLLPTIAAFMETRLPRFLAVLEKAYAANTTGSGWVVGAKMTFADVVLFNFIRGYRSSQPKHYADNAAIPLMKAHTAKMDALPRVKAFLASDRCTAMEAETSSPLAEKPHVQVNSFM